MSGNRHLRPADCLMLTGMPISISLGLTVLTFLFTMTDVPLESVALKLFTGIEKFEIMAIRFHPCGQLPDARGVAKRMIRFATGSSHCTAAWRSAASSLRAVCGSVRFVTATVVASARSCCAMVKQGYPNKFGVGVIGTAGRWAS